MPLSSLSTVLTLLLTLMLLGGCATRPFSVHYAALDIEEPTRDDLRRVLNGDALLGERAGRWDPDGNIFALSPPMRTFLDAYVYGRGREMRLRQLVGALINGDSLRLTYNPFKTYSARDTFYYQQGNCLSFTIMVVAMAREVGLKAYFNEVDVPPTWDMHDENTYVFYKHVNAVVEIGGGRRQVVDINLEDYEVSYPQRIINDKLATAQYYNNRGIEKLYDNDIENAFRYLRKAIELEPEVGYLWGSLGTIYRRAGFLREAEIAYLRALQVSPGEVVSISNLERLYTQLGEKEKAELFFRLASQVRRKNPYYRYKLAQQEAEEGNLDRALEHIQAAIEGYDKEHRFYHYAAIVYQKMGDEKSVRENLEKAAEMAAKMAADGEEARYRGKLERLLAVHLH